MNDRKRYLDIGEARAQDHAGVKPSRVTRALILFYVIAALLNGEHLHEQAKRMPYGAWRDACVAITRPLAYTSRHLYMSKPRLWLEHVLHTED